MARFQHTVTLAPVPRRWFESCVVTLHDLAESLEADGARLRLPDGRRLPEPLLTEGSHLRPGARYHPEDDDGSGPDIDQTLTILAWDRNRETALELVTLDDGPDSPGHMACTLRLTNAERPREAELSMKLCAGGGKGTKYADGSARLHLDFGKWWATAAGRGRRTTAPVTGKLDHALARATVAAVPRPADDGCWRVTVTMRVTGRSFFRLLLPLAMTVMGRRAREAFSKALDDAAKQWNDQVPELVRKDKEQLSLELVESLFGTDEERTGPSLDV
jgi:hypothetical protein